MAFMIGIRPCKLISELAKQKKLDLVLVNEGVTPFICKLLDYRLHMYDRFKKEYLVKYVEKGQLIRKSCQQTKPRTNITIIAQRQNQP